MSHVVSLHFENPSEDSSLDTKLDALDIPIAKGDHVEVIGIWRNSDGSVGIHVEVVEKADLEQNAANKNSSLDDSHDSDHNTAKEVQRIPSDDITTSDGNDALLEPTPEMKEAEEELEDDFEEAAERSNKVTREVEKSYEKQRNMEADQEPEL